MSTLVAVVHTSELVQTDEFHNTEKHPPGMLLPRLMHPGRVFLCVQLQEYGLVELLNYRSLGGILHYGSNTCFHSPF